MKYNIKMEWVFALLVFSVVTAMFFITPNKDIQLQASGAIIGSLTMALGYLFGKSKPDA